MEFNLEKPQNPFFIRAVEDNGIRVDQDLYTRPFIIHSDGVIPEWNVSGISDIDESSLEAIFMLKPEVVIIGTGSTQVFLPPETQRHFFKRQVGFEVMSTDAACRTFNVLASEGREVVAALLPPVW